MTYIIGVFGKIGAGKSTFINLLKHYIKAEFLSADVESREIQKDKNYISTLKNYFPECFDGEVLNKATLRNLIFEDREKNDLLKSLSHGLIRSRLLKKIEITKQKVVFVEISVYVENFIDFDELWLVTANLSKQIKRLSMRDNIDEKIAYNRINFQYIPDEKLFSQIILNDGNMTALAENAKFCAESVKLSLNLTE